MLSTGGEGTTISSEKTKGTMQQNGLFANASEMTENVYTWYVMLCCATKMYHHQMEPGTE